MSANLIPPSCSTAKAVVAIATPIAKELAQKYPEGCRAGQARCAINAALIQLGLANNDSDWPALETNPQYGRLSCAVLQR